MKNIFLKFLFLILLATLGNVINAQEYLGEKDAIEALLIKSNEADDIIAEFQDNKNMEYYKAVATKKIIKSLIGEFKIGKSTQEVAEQNSKAIPINKVQRITPLFPDSTVKYGSTWIQEEILVLMIKQ